MDTRLQQKIFHDLIGVYLKSINKTKLSKASLETLAIIAYNQPATKPLVEHIRGVNSDYSIQKLLDKNLIEISGREEDRANLFYMKQIKDFLIILALKRLKISRISKNSIKTQIQ